MYFTGGGGTDNWICVVYFMIGLTFYAVLIYDFGTDREHCFMPVRPSLSPTSSLQTCTNETMQ